MKLDDSIEKLSKLADCVQKYYEDRSRYIRIVHNSSLEPCPLNDKYYVDFLVDRRAVFRYSVGCDERNYFSMVLIGIGPCFVSPMALLDYDDARKFSIEGTTEAVEHNLGLLDLFGLTTQYRT